MGQKVGERRTTVNRIGTTGVERTKTPRPAPVSSPVNRTPMITPGMYSTQPEMTPSYQRALEQFNRGDPTKREAAKLVVNAPPPPVPVTPPTPAGPTPAQIAAEQQAAAIAAQQAQFWANHEAAQRMRREREEAESEDGE